MKRFFIALTLSAALTNPVWAQMADRSDAPAAPKTTDQMTPAPEPMGNQKDTLMDAVTAPLGDLNLNQAAIPPILLQAETAPYAPLAKLDCPSIAYAVAPLDAVLGADLDTPPSPLNPSLLERGSVLAGDTAISAVRSGTEGLVPFRSWVRKLTGAEAHSKKVRAAIAAGAVRRAYLKGLGQAIGCAPPAAPVSVKLPNKTNP